MKLLDRRFLAGKPSQDLLKNNLAANPNNFRQILDDHLRHKAYTELSKRIPGGPDRFDYEWLINPFQYTRQAIPVVRLSEFADYLNDCSVWQYAAPHFLDSAASTQVLKPMLNSCPKDRAQDLADRLNAKGLLSASFKTLGLSPEVAMREWGITVS